jgi:hypothetical protein
MLKQAFLSTVVVIASACPLAAQPTTQLGSGTEQIPKTRPLPEAEIVDYTFVFAAFETTAIEPALMDEITAWLVSNFDLPAPDLLPKVKFASPGAISAIHYQGLLDEKRQVQADSGPAPANGGSEIVAVYDIKNQTIFLPEGWRGKAPAEVSLLVHEMVHHLQTRAHLKFACPEEREKMAFAAQALWLDRFGLSLASEFELDGFTLLVRTNCGF